MQDPHPVARTTDLRNLLAARIRAGDWESCYACLMEIIAGVVTWPDGTSKRVGISERRKTATWLLEQGFGKATESLQITAHDSPSPLPLDLSNLSDDEFNLLSSLLSKALPPPSIPVAPENLALAKLIRPHPPTPPGTNTSL